MIHVKICGITNLEDARVAVEAGADLLGFIFYPPSPRFVPPEAAKKIISIARCFSLGTRFVGVFVNQPVECVRAVMEIAGLDYAQLHGQESVALVSALGPRVFKSLQPRDERDAHAMSRTFRPALNGNTPAFIVDGQPQKLPGGNGSLADWNMAYGLAREFPILLAGGLNPDNVREAIRQVQPWGVDVSSGVERAPGLKDHPGVIRFIENAKSQFPHEKLVVSGELK